MRRTSVVRQWLLWMVVWSSVAVVAPAQSASDSDRDGLSDDKEQALLEKFRPTFMISPTDCAVRPSSFKPSQGDPQAVAQDGTIYGQVFPVPNSTRVEIHYYMLWDKDCGRISHPLDVEHVSALVTNETRTEPKALYWYAGAHEGTACDISSGARAEAVSAEHKGPRVWSSSGKHAMYFRQVMCGHGCGADSCEPSLELRVSGGVVNLGERAAPVNGAEWTASKQWLLAEKMNGDFPAAVTSMLDASSGEAVVTLRGRSAIRGTIQTSDTVLGAAGTGAQHTGAALDTANTHTSNSLGTATKATGRSLKRAWKAVFGPKKDKADSAEGARE